MQNITTKKTTLVNANNQKTKSIYKSTLLLNSWLYSFAAISMFFISVPFVKIWLGNEYVLSQAVVLTLVINFYINYSDFTFEPQHILFNIHLHPNKTTPDTKDVQYCAISLSKICGMITLKKDHVTI